MNVIVLLMTISLRNLGVRVGNIEEVWGFAI